MVLPGASVLIKGQKPDIPLVAAQIWVSFWASQDSKNPLLTPTHESIITSNLFSVVLLSCSLRLSWRARKKSIWEDGTRKPVEFRHSFV